MDRLIFSYDEVYEAFESGKKYYLESAVYAGYEAFQTISLIENEVGLRFNMEMFLQELRDYLSSTGDIQRTTVMIRSKEVIRGKQGCGKDLQFAEKQSKIGPVCI